MEDTGSLKKSRMRLESLLVSGQETFGATVIVPLPKIDALPASMRKTQAATRDLAIDSISAKPKGYFFRGPGRYSN
jgi:hypothetical protein